MKPHPFFNFKQTMVVFDGEINNSKVTLYQNEADGFMNKLNPNEAEIQQIRHIFKHFAIVGPQKYCLNMLNKYFITNKDWNHPILGNLDDILSYINDNWSENDMGINLVKAYLESVKSPKATLNF